MKPRELACRGHRPDVITSFCCRGSDGEQDWAWGEPEVTGAAAASAEQSLPDRGVILTPDQRVRVFISPTLGELAEERAAARRAIRRLHLVPVWHESGAWPNPPSGSPARE